MPKNTNNKKCNLKECCPHMSVDSKGRYAGTHHKHKLKYKRITYEFRTCCNQCGVNMLELQKNNPELFERLYIAGYDTKRNLKLKHRDTGKVVQVAKRLRRRTLRSKSRASLRRSSSLRRS